LSWLARQPQPGAVRRLICFPYAGAGASVYREWVSDADFDVLPVRLPGRETRLGEPPREQMDALADELAEALDPVLDREFCFYGHSMGAVLAYEVARRLQDDSSKCPTILFVAASAAPGNTPPSQLQSVARLPDRDLVDVLAGYFGVDEALRHPELIDLLLPALRGDFMLLESYRPGPVEPLPYPIVGLYGKEDLHHDREVLAGWRDLTGSSFTLEAMSGNHFFAASEPERVMAVLRRHLASAS
jgi:surfactin synthase thioesterase subunit